jgi:hypothetical protein
MGSITKSLGGIPLTQNLGGIAQLYYVEAENVLLIPEMNGMAYPSDIVLQVGQYWNRIAFTSQTVTPVIKKNENTHGTYYEGSMKGIVPHDSRENLLALDQMHELIIAYMDMEGQMKILGTAETPVKASFSHTNPAQTRGRKGFTFEFTYKGLLPALFYDGQLTDNPVFIADFSFTTSANNINLLFEGNGSVEVQFEIGLTETFNTGEAIVHNFDTAQERTIKVRFEDRNNITGIEAKQIGISEPPYIASLPALELVDLTNNNLTTQNLESLLTTIDSAAFPSNMIISLYGNQSPNQAVADLISSLQAKNISVEISWFELNTIIS